MNLKLNHHLNITHQTMAGITTDPGPRLATWYSNECFSPALKEEFSFSTEN